MIDTPDTRSLKPLPRECCEKLLHALYPAAVAESAAAELRRRLDHPGFPVTTAAHSQPLTRQDVLLITYADQLRAPGIPPLQTLAAFCHEHLHGLVSGVHLLPFYPWTSDDGFSVKDYLAVAPEYGTWADVALFRPAFDLMFDAVFNHLSSESVWFQRFLQDDPDFRDFFVTVVGHPDLTRVVRPRALPLLTEFSTARGPERVWTTFSADQVDVNVKNPRVVLALLDALLYYVAQGARFIRLDAIAYLWKEIGTPCIHLPQTHQIIQLMRAVLDAVAPAVQLITETNVPHQDNISYFGDGSNEAQLVYNFALPPLVLHALLRGDATHLSRWAATLRTPSDRTTFFNFLASHDGIGLNPARGILPPGEIDFLVDRCLAHGGFINYKHNADGSKSPYEMNIVYFDAVNDPAEEALPATQVARFLVSQAIMLALAGVPGIYFHSLFGSRNDRAAAVASGINRRINRQKFAQAELTPALQDPGSLRSQIFNGYRGLLQVRQQHPAFDPQAEQQILATGPGVFGIRRGNHASGWVLCLHNVTADPATLLLEPASARDLIRNRPVRLESRLELPPYGIQWLAGQGELPRLTGASSNG